MDLLAYGGMAEIYRAKTFDSLGNEYAVVLKRVLQNLASNEDLIRMLIDEARIASMLHHPCIVRTYEFCQVQDEYFMVMELVDGKDLKTVLEKSGEIQTLIPVADAVYITICALEGLHAAHVLKDHQGKPFQLIHRDMSPSNILISYAGDVKICDFGIAKTNRSTIQTQIGIVRGKVKYMSPEQAMGWKLDLRTDIYSLGSVLYEMLTGNPPFLAANEVDLLKKVKEGRYTPIRQTNPSVPAQLQAIVHKALSKDRMSRFQSASEFSHALKTFLNSHAPTYTPVNLSFWMENTFRNEHQNEQQMLDQFDFAQENPADVGVNLLAESDDDSADQIIPVFMAQPATTHRPDEVPRWLMRETTQVFEISVDGDESAEHEHGRQTDQFDTRDLFEGAMTPTAVPENSQGGDTGQFSIGPTLMEDHAENIIVESYEPEIVEKSAEPAPEEDFILQLTDKEEVVHSPESLPDSSSDTGETPEISGTGTEAKHPVRETTAELVSFFGELIEEDSPDITGPVEEIPETGTGDVPSASSLEQDFALEVDTGDIVTGETNSQEEEPKPPPEPIPDPLDAEAEEPAGLVEGSDDLVDMLDLDDIEEPEPLLESGNPSSSFAGGEIVLGTDSSRDMDEPSTMDIDPFEVRVPDTSPGTPVKLDDISDEGNTGKSVPEDTGDFLISISSFTDNAENSNMAGEIGIVVEQDWQPETGSVDVSSLELTPENTE